MNNDNVVKIGKALKWRNTFDLTQRYYQENIVTACGCVFRCKVLQAQGKSPIKMTDDQGHIVYTNTDVWDVLVDMAYYYNYAVDARKLTQEMLAYAKKLDEAFKKQQKEIEAIQKDNLDQWGHINAIETHNTKQQREIDSILDTISCFSEGIWIDTLLWSNETIWDNNKYAITDDLQNQINELTATHCQDIKDLTDKHNSEISSLAAHIIQQEKIQDGINTYLQNQVYDLNNALSCFGSGIWENDLHWSQEALWDNNKYAITDALTEELKEMTDTHKNDVEAINKHLIASDKAFADAMTQNAKEHRLVNEHLDKHDTDIQNLQTLINEHDRQIIDLLDRLTCYSDGQWDNNLKWSNQALWENSNQMCDTFEDIYLQITEHLKAINDLKAEIQQVKKDAAQTLKEINDTFAGFQKEHEDFRKDHQEFAKEHDLFTERLDGHDTLLAEHQYNLDSLLYRISLLTNGVWDNHLLWNNDSDWVNSDLNGSCHCPADTEERLDELQQGLDNLTQIVSDNTQSISECQSDIIDVSSKTEANSQVINIHSEQIEEIKEAIVTEHRSVAYQLRAIGREQQAQDINIAKIGEHFSCYADGIWGDLFVWDNELLWANQTGVINVALEDIRNDIRDTRYKLNEANEDIMTNLSLIRANQQLIKNNTEDIYQNQKAIEETQQIIDKSVDALRSEALTEHRQVAYQIRAIGRDQKVQDENIAKLGEHFNCFADGIWCNLFVWENNRLWANTSGVLKNALEDIHIELDSHQETLNSLIEEKNEHFSCFHDDIWCNSSIWNNNHLWPFDIFDITNSLQKHNEEIAALQISAEKTNTQLSNKITNLKNDFSEISNRVESNSTHIQKNQEQLNSNSEKIDKITNSVQELSSELELQSENLHNALVSEHRQVAYQLRAIDRDQAVQNENIAKLGEHFNCFVDGVWCNLFLWENDDLWANTSGVVKQAIDDIHVELDSHQKTLDAIIEENNEHFTCFSDDVWCNSSGWDNGRLWPSDFVIFAQAIQNNQTAIEILNQSVKDFKNATEKNLNAVSQSLNQTSEKADSALTAIAKQQEVIEQNSEKIDDNTSDIKDLSAYVDAAVNDIQNQAITEHRQVAYQLITIGREQIAQDENIAKLGEHFGCFVDGQWGDIFLWNNNHLWHNQTGVVEEAISDIHQEIDEVKENLTEVTEEIFDTFDNHQTQINELWEQNSCMDEGKWNNAFFWNNVALWLNTPESLVEVEAEINKHDTRLSALENQFKLFMEQFSVQQTIIRQQQEQLETLMDCFTVLNVGKWQNLLLWDNSSKWSNELITETSASNEGAGTATVTVKSYDPTTATVSF